MKQMHFLPAVLVILAVVAFTSCKPSRVWASKDRDRSTKEKEAFRDRKNDYEDRHEPPPTPHPTTRYYVNTPLILTPSVGFVINSYPDGRFYHRNTQGFIYWKAFDNRFYLDKSYIHRVRYDRFEYQRWKEYQDTYNSRKPY